MDCHVHIGGRPGDGGDTHKLKETIAHEAIYGTVHAKITLDVGFTTIRNVGAGNYHDAALRDLINEGVVPGPAFMPRPGNRVAPAATPISTVGIPI